MNDLEIRILKYVKELDRHHETRSFHFSKGRKYYRVYWRFLSRNGHESGSEIVFCFIDGYGNIYKPEGWKRPAAGVRATLNNPVYTDGELYKRA